MPLWLDSNQRKSFHLGSWFLSRQLKFSEAIFSRFFGYIYFSKSCLVRFPRLRVSILIIFCQCTSPSQWIGPNYTPQLFPNFLWMSCCNAPAESRRKIAFRSSFGKKTIVIHAPRGIWRFIRGYGTAGAKFDRYRYMIKIFNI